MNTLKITQLKSAIGRLPTQKATLAALGLKKINASVTKVNNDCIQGMVRSVQHLIKVEEIQ